MAAISVSGNGLPTASRGPLEFFQLANAHRIERISYGTKPPARYRRHDRSDRELSMAMAAGAMGGGTSPPSPLRSPAPSLRSTAPSLRSPAHHLHSPSPPIRSPFPAASIPSGEVSGAAAMRGGRGGVRALLSAVKVTDPAALAAMEGLNPRRGQGSCSTPEMGHQEASNGGETRLADTSSTAARFPASSSRTQQHLGSGVLAGKKPLMHPLIQKKLFAVSLMHAFPLSITFH